MTTASACILDVFYTIPVWVQIKSGEIARVIVGDESATLAQLISAAVRDILEAQEWPAREFGR